MTQSGIVPTWQDSNSQMCVLQFIYKLIKLLMTCTKISLYARTFYYLINTTYVKETLLRSQLRDGRITRNSRFTNTVHLFCVVTKLYECNAIFVTVMTKFEEYDH